MRIAINGMGRIGKTLLRILLKQAQKPPQIIPIAINIGPAELTELISTIKYDSIMGPLTNHQITLEGSTLLLDSWKISVFQETEPEKLPWGSLGIDWVVECSGFFTERSEAERHIHAGARNVLISAPAKSPDCTIIPGVNDTSFIKSKDHIVSLGSCTTNAIAPLIKVLLSATHIESLHMVTTHAYTNTQALLDSIPNSSKDTRRFRAAAINIVPGSTGAGLLMGEIFPQLKNKTSALALRVPVANVSLVELTWHSQEKIDRHKLISAFQDAAKTTLNGILATSEDPVVSSDFIGSPYSVTLDIPLTAITENVGSVFGWYDNEYGYCNRLIDFLQNNI